MPASRIVSVAASTVAYLVDTFFESPFLLRKVRILLTGSRKWCTGAVQTSIAQESSASAAADGAE